MDFNNYTLKAQEAVQDAANIAKSHKQQAIETGHLLKALIQGEESIIPYFLRKLGINLSFLSQKLEEILHGYPQVSGASGGQYISNNLNQVLENANEEAGKNAR